MATIWQRALARIIDSAIYLVLGVVALAVGTSATVSPTDSYTGFQFHVMFAFVLAAMFTAAVALLYEWLFVAFRGATPGKMALRIKVVDQNTGGLMGLGPAFVRPLIILVPTVFPYLGMLISLAVLLSPLFDASGRLQGWHDKAAGDLVIGTGQRTASARTFR
ncbi:MAG TPA: RDD family protein [Mycobacterium sp.]|nr:RDD family protein [Mycobacterium sp.]